MSTRGAIARVTNGEHFEGRYHHWDSYPTALGKTLWDLYHGHFKQDIKAMLNLLIDQHPAGWSTINRADFTKKPGYSNHYDPEKPHRPFCYCHGDRHETPQLVTDKNASDIGCEYVYAFNGDEHMLILSSYNDDGSKMIGMFGCGNPDAEWKIIADVDLNGVEPDWQKIG